jgi:hypothetical protein
MPQNIVDSPEWTTPLVVPANGDPVDGDGWEFALQGVGNRTAYMRAAIPGRAAQIWVRKLPPVAVENTSSRFQYLFTGFGGISGWQQIDQASAGDLYLTLDDLPMHGWIASVTGILVWGGGTGSGQHPASLPATKPRLLYWEDDMSDLDGASYFESSWVTDPSGTLGAYIAKHEISVTSFHASHDLNLSNLVKRGIRFQGEAGANSAAGMTLAAIEVEIVDEEP